MVKELLRMGADPKAEDAEGYTPVWYCLAVPPGKKKPKPSAAVFLALMEAGGEVKTSTWFQTEDDPRHRWIHKKFGTRYCCDKAKEEDG